MTDKEKAKAYDEAIRKAKIILGCCNSDSIITEHTIYDIFPELNESEDERMIKFIKQQLFNIKKTITENYELDTKLTKAIDWLEKQGEQKSTLNFKAKDWYVSKVDGKIYNAKFMEKTPTNIARKLEIEKAAMSATGILEQEEWFIKGAEWSDKNPSYVSSEKQGEQKPYGQRKECEDCQFNYAGECKGSCQMKRGEQKPAEWSEDDERMLHTIIADFKGFIRDNTSTLESHFNECIDWLKSLKDRVQPKHKQEWSEEDEDYINDLIKYFSQNERLKNTKEDIVNWLKFLRPKNKWKPSDDEIEKASQEWDSKAIFNPFYMTMDGDKPTGVKQDITTHKESFKAGVEWILKKIGF